MIHELKSYRIPDFRLLVEGRREFWKGMLATYINFKKAYDLSASLGTLGFPIGDSDRVRGRTVLLSGQKTCPTSFP